MFSEAVKVLWGKKKTINGTPFYLPCIQHLLDAKNACGYLYENYLSQSQRDLLGPKITKNIAGFLGFVHDIGKFTPAFQIKKAAPINTELDAAIDRNICQYFPDFKMAILPNGDKTPHNIAGNVLLENFGISPYFAALIGAHHGQALSKSELIKQAAYPENYGNISWQKIQREVFDYGMNSLTDSEKQYLQTDKLSQTQSVLLTGLIIAGDWLASNTDYFPLLYLNQTFDDINQTKRPQKAFDNFAREDPWQHKPIRDLDQYFLQHFNFKPSPLQRKMLNIINTIKRPGLIVIEAPMGSGKTETALTAASILNKDLSGVFYGLPTQATSNAMLPRLAKWLSCENGNHGLKLIHAKAKFNKFYQDLEQHNSHIVQNRWYSGKLSPLEHFTIGTIDQLLSMSLAQRHLFLKHLAFSGKVVIIDEVHACDIYMQSYLNKTLMYLGLYKIPVIAMSATLPNRLREDLIKSYLRNNNLKLPNVNAYPLLTYTDGMQAETASDFSALPVRHVDFKIMPDNAAAIAQKADSLAKHGVIGVIVNSVERAQEIYRQITSPKILLHSQFLPRDREKIERDILHRLGKNGNRPKSLVVIGTQVLEQSLDIDFDALVSDLAPMDSLFQRVGRLQRRKLNRNPVFKDAICYMAYTQDSKSFKTSSYLYSQYLLNLTLKYLPKTAVLPGDIASYVNKVYAGDPKENGYRDFMSKLALEKQKAKAFQIKKPNRIAKPLSKWLKIQVKNENGAQSCVRDIEPRVEASLIINKNDNPSETALLLPRKVCSVKQADALPQHLGMPCIHLDKHNTCELNGYRITYDSHLGLICKRL